MFDSDTFSVFPDFEKRFLYDVFTCFPTFNVPVGKDAEGRKELEE